MDELYNLVGTVEELDRFVISYLGVFNFRPHEHYFVIRAGSSLHPEVFKEDSDIDYFVVADVIPLDLINKFPSKISPDLRKEELGEELRYFYWRINLKPIGKHPVNVIFYTWKKFMEHVEQRSGPKMYLLDEHKLLEGDKDKIEYLKENYKPNIDTAKSDLSTLANRKYDKGNEKFLWQWRSVCLLKEGRWLKNKQQIIEWVNKKYPGKIGIKPYLYKVLQGEINEKTYRM